MIQELALSLRLSTMERIELYTASHTKLARIDSEAAHTYITRVRQLLDEIEKTVPYCHECGSHLLSGNDKTGYACDNCGHEWSV